MANKTFEQYFKDRGALVGAPASVGDEILVLRSDTVFRAKAVDNRAMLYMANNATETTISGVDVWTTIGGTLAADYKSASYTFATNQLTYVGPDQAVPAMFTINATLTKTLADAEDFEIGLFANAVQVLNGARVTVDQTPLKAAVTCTVLYTLSTGDVLDFRIRNRTGTEGVTITDAQLVVV